MLYRAVCLTCLSTVLCVALLLAGCKPAGLGSTSAPVETLPQVTTTMPETGAGESTTSTAGSFLLQGPAIANGTSDTSSVISGIHSGTTDAEDGFELFTTVATTPSAGLTSTGVVGSGHATPTSVPTQTENTPTTSPYENEDNWVDGSIPRK